MLGLVAAGGYVLSTVSYINYFFRNLTDIFELIFIAGMVAAIFLAWTGWTAYRAEQGTKAPAATPPPPPPPPAS